MTMTLTHVWTDKNKLVYLCTNDGSPLGGTGTLPMDGGVTPDAVTDGANAGFGEANGAALAKALRSGLDGNGSVAAGTWIQAQARALLLLDGATGIGGINTPRLQCDILGATGAAVWRVDADVDGAGIPEVNVTSSAVAGTAYLHISLVHSLDN